LEERAASIIMVTIFGSGGIPSNYYCPCSKKYAYVNVKEWTKHIKITALAVTMLKPGIF
jgi:hypothetical protein